MSDEEIISLLFLRDEKAVYEISEKYKAYCAAVAENILGNPEDTEECLNSVWLSIWNSVPPESPKNLKIFLARITRNLAIDMLKARTAEKRGGKEGTEIFDELSETLPSEENIEEEIIGKELGEKINCFVSKLPQKERGVFIRRYFFFESAEAIGRRYSLSSRNVSVVLHRIRKKLKKHLEKEGFFP